MFGLHANAEIGYNESCTRQIWADLVELQPRGDSSSTGVTREDYVMQLVGKVNAMIPDPFERHVVAAKLGVPSPTQVVLLQVQSSQNILEC